jgi:hypothetical protein
VDSVSLAGLVLADAKPQRMSGRSIGGWRFAAAVTTAWSKGQEKMMQDEHDCRERWLFHPHRNVCGSARFKVSSLLAGCGVCTLNLKFEQNNLI